MKRQHLSQASIYSLTISACTHLVLAHVARPLLRTRHILRAGEIIRRWSLLSRRRTSHPKLFRSQRVQTAARAPGRGGRGWLCWFCAILGGIECGNLALRAVGGANVARCRREGVGLMLLRNTLFAGLEKERHYFVDSGVKQAAPWSAAGARRRLGGEGAIIGCTKEKGVDR